MMVRCSNRSSKVNVSRANMLQSDQCRDHQQCARKEDDPVRKEVSNRSHEGGSDQAAARLEPLIAAQPFGKTSISHQAKADGRNTQPDSRGGHTLQHQSREHNCRHLSRWRNPEKPHLTVLDPPGRSTVLASHSDRVRAFLQEPCLIDG
jgi:hypothetical protein